MTTDNPGTPERGDMTWDPNWMPIQRGQQMDSCATCGAAVARYNRDVHDAWHTEHRREVLAEMTRQSQELGGYDKEEGEK